MSSRAFFARAAVLAGLALAAAPADAANPVYPLASHVGLVAPGAMKPSERFRGFEDPATGASILILEVPAQAYPEVEKQMTAEALKKQGMTEEKRENVTLTVGKGLLIVGEQAVDAKKMRKWVFLATGAEVGALIAVQVPDEARGKYTDADVRTALMSMSVRPSVPIDEQMRLLPISLDNLSGMRPFRMLPNGTLFLTDGAKDPPDVAAAPLLIISVAPGGPQEPTDRANFARNLFTGLNDFKDLQIRSADMLRLDNQQTHEIQAEAKDVKTGVPMKLVQWVRFGNGAFIRFVGIARTDAWTQAFPQFRAVRDGVKPKG
ncbi:MAG TPA: hypothetical protein VLX44_12835 [Xanthobacteraceae bacterium]|nr:hypothetical protein [Xanthobacteraceae bacterium]